MKHELAEKTLAFEFEIASLRKQVKNWKDAWFDQRRATGKNYWDGYYLGIERGKAWLRSLKSESVEEALANIILIDREVMYLNKTRENLLKDLKKHCDHKGAMPAPIHCTTIHESEECLICGRCKLHIHQPKKKVK
jgi:hypothetical protein